MLHAVDLSALKRPPALPPSPCCRPRRRCRLGCRRPTRRACPWQFAAWQGNLFFGHVLARLAFLAGYHRHNIIKGDTHGMAQMGGPVISTFGCGAVASPVLLPGSADCLIAMEQSEVLRPGFLEML